ncbi:subtilisin-like protease SBT4.8 isoform X2 [Arachis stenosperma]|uniref:subtilisin-like protease SBT4.8 isoform X2 n=1 Tax=Arachis stenosperma TaxID=217475 RepID=UPI0025ACA7E2|nr:subtilisin-like protease SBT4.8 isoform X2 [Arachis stenosperma]XP_057720863.1 subtilisin-like protease SBT4.8 isoform X2 [Arachis stenosperma]XP_057720864.1 subtilisin-like protease SBT4.8 isoform X2 [Arachis stenosperma]
MPFSAAAIPLSNCLRNASNKGIYYLCSGYRNLHIVYMGSLPKNNYSPTSHHLSMLQQITNDNDATNHMVRSYYKSFNGFAAMITNQEREKLKKMEGVISVFPSKSLKPQTTRSWDFMGFKESIQRNKTVESDVIIGVIDTGIWPESESFNDHGFGPIPKKWKGACKGGENFRCNNKIIGARYYLKDQTSARDFVGHGTHTASIAAGNKVVGASFNGIAEGVARGGVPSARIAAYSVCNNEEQGCRPDAILAAFDDAIADGVDLITISIGQTEQVTFDKDTIAIGSFHAMKKGILTINSAGNDGPNTATFSVSPWLFTVAATTMDRVLLGNGLMPLGKSINGFASNSAEILSSAGFINNSAPIVAEFSSVGPNMQIREIMKPDISAPGVDILAAYSPLAPPSPDKRDKRSVKYNIRSGTSMACPHVAGAAAYVKTFHPDWSPAVIKSSLMTTAKPMNGSQLAEFSYGSGFLDPVRAINPGLVFDASKKDYVKLLCRIGYDTMEVRKISGDKSVCPSSSSHHHLPMTKDFNYPAIAAEIEPNKPFRINFTRTVTNVGFANSTYKVYIQQPSGINITVVPNILEFKSLKEKQSFVVHVVGGKFSDYSVVSSSLLWSDGTHTVRCPIILRVIKGKCYFYNKI